MTEIDDISARLIVLETVVRQLITHMAVRDDDPPQWVQTRKTLAMSVIDPGRAGRGGPAPRCDGRDSSIRRNWSPATTARPTRRERHAVWCVEFDSGVRTAA